MLFSDEVPGVRGAGREADANALAPVAGIQGGAAGGCRAFSGTLITSRGKRSGEPPALCLDDDRHLA